MRKDDHIIAGPPGVGQMLPERLRSVAISPIRQTTPSLPGLAPAQRIPPASPTHQPGPQAGQTFAVFVRHAPSREWMRHDLGPLPYPVALQVASIVRQYNVAVGVGPHGAPAPTFLAGLPETSIVEL